MANVLCCHICSSRSKCTEPSRAVFLIIIIIIIIIFFFFLISLISCFTGTFLRYFLRNFEMLQLPPSLQVYLVFLPSTCAIFLFEGLQYFKIFSGSFFTTFLSLETAMPINTHLHYHGLCCQVYWQRWFSRFALIIIITIAIIVAVVIVVFVFKR